MFLLELKIVQSEIRILQLRTKRPPVKLAGVVAPLRGAFPFVLFLLYSYTKINLQWFFLQYMYCLLYSTTITIRVLRKSSTLLARTILESIINTVQFESGKRNFVFNIIITTFPY